MNDKRSAKLASRESRAWVLFVVGLFAFVLFCNVGAYVLDHWGEIVGWANSLSIGH